MSEKDGKSKYLIANPDTDSQIDYLDVIKEIYDIDVVTGEKVKFHVTKFKHFILKKEVKNLIYDAIAYGLSRNFYEPFTILVPKKLITRRNMPVGEIPFPFGNHTVIIVPYIREVMVYEQWKE